MFTILAHLFAPLNDIYDSKDFVDHKESSAFLLRPDSWVPISGVQFDRCVTEGRLYIFSVIPFPHLSNGDNATTHLIILYYYLPHRLVVEVK